MKESPAEATPVKIVADQLSFALVYLVPTSVVIGYMLGGYYTFLTPFFVFGLVPLLDILIGIDARNPRPEAEQRLVQKRGYRYLTWACMPMQVAMVLWGIRVVSAKSPGWLEAVGLTVSVGVCSGILGINVAHELAHRVNSKGEPLLSRIMLASVLYGHWEREHVAGHHRWVATPKDPATAVFGQSYYAFWPQTVFGGLQSAWRFHKNRLRRQGKNVFSRHNPMLLLLGAEGALVLAVLFYSGPRGALFFTSQAVIAVSLLEIVNYIEHYAMVRRQLSDGGFTPVTPKHSWNSSNWLTNRFLFNLQRHSDHHYRPGRRYQTLRHHDESPQLPTGYAGMIVLAAVPPLWRRIMDPKVEALRIPESA
jgi:alkane 1-monooxygenase